MSVNKQITSEYFKWSCGWQTDGSYYRMGPSSPPKLEPLKHTMSALTSARAMERAKRAALTGVNSRNSILSQWLQLVILICKRDVDAVGKLGMRRIGSGDKPFLSSKNMKSDLLTSMSDHRVLRATGKYLTSGPIRCSFS